MSTQSAYNEYMQKLYAQGDTLRSLLSKTQTDALMNALQATGTRKGRESSVTDYINNIPTRQVSNDVNTENLLSRYLGDISSAFNPYETGVNQALDKAFSAEQAYIAPELEAFYGSRGMPLNSGAVNMALAKQLASQSMKRFDVTNQVQQQKLQAMLGAADKRAGLTREDLITQRTNEMNNFLRQLGFAREDENTAKGFQNILRFDTPMNLESQILQFQRGGAGGQVDIASKAAEQSRGRQDAFMSSLMGAGASLLSPTLGAAGNQLANRVVFPSIGKGEDAQNQALLDYLTK